MTVNRDKIIRNQLISFRLKQRSNSGFPMVRCGLEKVNYSVWLGSVNSAKQPALKEKFVKLINDERAAGSLFYIFPVAQKDVKRMRTITGRKPKELDYWLGEKHTLFFYFFYRNEEMVKMRSFAEFGCFAPEKHLLKSFAGRVFCLLFVLKWSLLISITDFRQAQIPSP